MNVVGTLIIIDPTNRNADTKLHELLRCCMVDYITGYCEDFYSPCNTKSCIWYFINHEISFGNLELGLVIGGKYKMMTTDGNSFSCNCADVDLPMIEDVWEIINKERL